MKKILCAVFALATLFAVVGCKSSKNNADALAGTKQAEENTGAKWAKPGVMFPSNQTQGYLGSNYVSTEDGWYAVGAGDTGDTRSKRIAARLQARQSMAGKLKTAMADAAESKGGVGSETTVEQISAILVGSYIVDTFTGNDGAEYVLMFISAKDLEKSAKETKNADLSYLVDLVIAETFGDSSSTTK